MLVVKVQHGEDTDANVEDVRLKTEERLTDPVESSQKCETCHVTISGNAIYRHNEQARYCYTVGTLKYCE